MQLALLPPGVRRNDAINALLRCQAIGQQIEAGRAIQRIHQSLGGERTDATPCMSAQGADGEKFACHRYAEMAGGIAGDDRPGHALPLYACTTGLTLWLMVGNRINRPLSDSLPDRAVVACLLRSCRRVLDRQAQ